MCTYIIPFAFLLLACILDIEPLTTSGEEIAGTCRECNYSLKGLVDGSRCPECGSSDPGLRPVKTLEWRYTIRPRRPVFLVFCVLILVCGLVGVEPLLREVLAGTYVADGYTWAVGRNAATTRVLRGRTNDAVAPIFGVIALLPLCSFLKNNRGTWVTAIVLLAAGLSCSVGWILRIDQK